MAQNSTDETQPALHPLVTTPSARNTEKRKRKDSYVRQTVSNSQADELIKQGWELDRRLAKRTRIKREKSISEHLENRAWLLLADLGFSELNAGRDFYIRFKRNNKISSQQKIDIFARDDETVIVAQCNASTHIRRKSLQQDIEAFSNLKGRLASAIRKHYGASFKPKIIWAFVTDKIIWSQEDRKRAAGENLSIITERELRYFAELAKHLGPAGRYQLLAYFLEGQKIPQLENRSAPAIRGKLAGRHFYAFVTTPSQLLKIAFVNHRTLNDPRGMPTYQRLISRKRMREIQSFIEAGGFFPTNIIINFTSKPRFEIRLKDDAANIHFGTLFFPDKYKSAWIIDGQHRLYGFTNLEEHQRSNNILVLAFHGLPIEEEANLFVTINHEQKTVPRTLLDDLQGELKWGSAIPRERLVAMASRLVNILNGDVGGPFHQRVVQTGLRGTKETCLTLPALVEAFRKSGLIGFVHRKWKSYQPGPFSAKDDFETLDRARHCFEDIFQLISEANPKCWRAGSEGGVCTNTGVSALVLLIAEALRHHSDETKLDVTELATEDVSLAIQDYLSPLLFFLRNSTISEISKTFKDGVPYGSRGPRELFLRLVRLIREDVPDFGPPDFERWLVEQNEERAKDAADKVQQLNMSVCRIIFSKFRQIYGDDLYWDKGVTNKQMKSDAYTRSLDDNTDERGPLEEYLNFIDYKKIVEKSENWQYFESIFNIKFPDEKHGQSKNLKWMDRVNSIRKKTAHKSANRSLTDQEISLIDFVTEEFFLGISNSKNFVVLDDPQ